MPNPQRTRHKTNSRTPGYHGNCQRNRYMWNGEMLSESFTLDVPSFESAYHHQVDTVGFQRNYFNPDWHLHVIVPSKGLQFLHFNSGRTSLGPGYGELQFSGKGLHPERLVEHVFSQIDEFEDFTMWVDDFAVKAEYHFKTAMKEGYSLLNFIIELIQLLSGNLKTAIALRDKILKAVKEFKRLYAKTGDYWLAWNFAIKPTLKDIKAMILSLDKARKRLKFLKKYNHIPIHLKYRQKAFEKELESFKFPIEELKYVDINNPNAFDMFRGGLDPETYYWRLNGMVFKCEPAANALCRFDIDDAYLDETYGLGVFWAAYNGLYNPLKVIWEALPFSWLIDWFISERGKLWQLLSSLSPLKDATILQWGHSLKWTIKGELYAGMLRGSKADYFNLDPAAFEPVPEEIHIGPIEITFYRRVPEIPSTGSSLFRLPLEWYNASIILALIAQKRRRKKR